MLERGDKGRQRLLSRIEAGIEESNLALWLDWNWSSIWYLTSGSSIQSGMKPRAEPKGVCMPEASRLLYLCFFVSGDVAPC